jgi:small subunit ribosomal protein S17e
MGRIRTTFIKAMSGRLLEAYPDKFGPDFNVNKKSLDELKILDEQRTRNKVSGYIVRLAKRKKTAA